MSLKYFKRLGIYKNYNGRAYLDVSADGKVHGTSYGWWTAVRSIGPFVVFNGCRYSSPTAKHLAGMRAVLNERGIKIDFELYCPSGIGENTNSWRAHYSVTAVEHYERELARLQNEVRNHKTRKDTNLVRQHQINVLNLELEALLALYRLASAKGPRRSSLIRTLRGLKDKIKRAKQAEFKQLAFNRAKRAKRKAELKAKRDAKQALLTMVQGGAK